MAVRSRRERLTRDQNDANDPLSDLRGRVLSLAKLAVLRASPDRLPHEAQYFKPVSHCSAPMGKKPVPIGAERTKMLCLSGEVANNAIAPDQGAILPASQNFIAAIGQQLAVKSRATPLIGRAKCRTGDIALFSQAP